MIKLESNTLYFDDEYLDTQFRNIIQQRISEDDIFDIFNKEVYLKPLDDTNNDLTKLPIIEFELYTNSPSESNIDDVQLELYTPFTVEINVYTGGEDKRRNNMKLCNELILTLQQKQPLGEYFSRGLFKRSNNETTSSIDNVCRRTIRMSGNCDNRLKLIKSK